MCLATDACPTADPGVASSIPARSHTFVKIDHEIISTVVLLPSAESFKKAGFPQVLEMMENLENHQKKCHAWKNHGI